MVTWLHYLIERIGMGLWDYLLTDFRWVSLGRFSIRVGFSYKPLSWAYIKMSLFVILLLWHRELFEFVHIWHGFKLMSLFTGRVNYNNVLYNNYIYFILEYYIYNYFGLLSVLYSIVSFCIFYIHFIILINRGLSYI